MNLSKLMKLSGVVGDSKRDQWDKIVAVDNRRPFKFLMKKKEDQQGSTTVILTHEPVLIDSSISIDGKSFCKVKSVQIAPFESCFEPVYRVEI